MEPRFNLRMIITGALIAALGATVPSAEAQFGRLRNALEKVSLSSLLKGDPPVTTSLDQALTAIEYLDHYEPTGFMSLSLQPQSAAGAFQLGPGVYEFGAESYCLKAGTYGPGAGDGYLYAPLAGPKGTSVRSILQSSVAHPEIPQRDVQVLLWAIIARTKISDMSRKNQETAARLLTPAQLFDLNGGALGLVPDSVRREAVQSLPPEALRIFEAEARLRQLLTQTDAAYDEIERVAVLLGDPAPDPNSREVPRGRWSYHPDGYFVRFFPSGYSRSEVHIYVPEPIAIVRDARGRITAIDDQRGARIEVAYAVGAGPATIVGEPNVQGHTFASIRFRQPDFMGPRTLVEGIGWTLTGGPRGSGQAIGNQTLVGLNERYRTAVGQAATWQKLLEQPSLRRRDGPPLDVRDLVDLAQFQLALEQAFKATGDTATSPRMSPVLELVARAWGTAFCEQAGGCARGLQKNAGAMLFPSARPGTASERSNPLFVLAAWGVPRVGFRGIASQQPVAAPLPTPTATVDLSNGVAVPGNRYRQRLGQSGRSQPNPNLCQGRWILAGSLSPEHEYMMGVPICFCYWDCEAFAPRPGPVIRSPRPPQRIKHGIQVSAISDPISDCICNKPGPETGWR